MDGNKIAHWFFMFVAGALALWIFPQMIFAKIAEQEVLDGSIIITGILFVVILSGSGLLMQRFESLADSRVFHSITSSLCIVLLMLFVGQVVIAYTPASYKVTGMVWLAGLTAFGILGLVGNTLRAQQTLEIEETEQPTVSWLRTTTMGLIVSVLVLSGFGSYNTFQVLYPSPQMAGPQHKIFAIAALGVALYLYGKGVVRGWYYFFVPHATAAIITPALHAQAPVDRAALGSELRNQMGNLDHSIVSDVNQAAKAQELKAKIDDDTAIALAKAKIAKARAAVLDAERELEDRRKAGNQP